MSSASRIAGLALTATLAVGCPAAVAATSRYESHTYTQTRSHGLPVTGPLSAYVVVATGRVVVPSHWKVLKAPAGQLRFRSGSLMCHYTTTFTITTRMASAGEDSTAYVTGALPAKGPRYVLDTGVHGNAAFRVVRAGGQPQTLDALWTGTLTRRADIAPAGQVVRTDIRVRSVSGPGDECHSGTWRQTLGPQLGDALATARTTLRFLK